MRTIRIVRLMSWGMVLLLAVNGLCGCSTLADARMERGKGPYKVYENSMDEAWAGVKKTIESVGLQYVSENREEGYILAQRGMSIFSYGENVAVFVEQLDGNKVRVEIVSKRSMSTNILAPNWTNKLFENLNTQLKLLKT